MAFLSVDKIFRHQTDRLFGDKREVCGGKHSLEARKRLHSVRLDAHKHDTNERRIDERRMEARVDEQRTQSCRCRRVAVKWRPSFRKTKTSARANSLDKLLNVGKREAA